MWAGGLVIKEQWLTVADNVPVVTYPVNESTRLRGESNFVW